MSPAGGRSGARAGRAAPLTLVAELAHAPFPFEPADEAFFDAGSPRRRTVGGNRYDEAVHYRDSRVLVHVPPRFDPAAKATLLLFLHGHRSKLRHAVVEAHAVPRQLDRSGVNMVLVAPQLARDASDSHPGKLSRQGGAAALLDEAVDVLSGHLDAAPLRSAPVIVAAFSGGYRAAADCLCLGGLGTRVTGCVIMDGLYGRVDDFAAWIDSAGRSGFFVALYGESTAANTEALAARLGRPGRKVVKRLPRRIVPGTVALVRVTTPHLDIPLAGPPRRPLTAILRRWAAGAGQAS